MGDHEAHGDRATGLVLTADASPPTAEDHERGRLLFAQACRFITAASSLASLPPQGLPEVAFAGRSNVGKSSLINALTGRNTLARTSKTPGRTRQINFFSLGDRLQLVDLPGYGYARASKTSIGAWTTLVHRYLEGRASLRRACLLIDARRGIVATDRAMMGRLDEAAVSYQIVLTKADALRTAELTARIAAIATELARHAAAHPEIVATSAHKGSGIPELRAALARLAGPP